MSIEQSIVYELPPFSPDSYWQGQGSGDILNTDDADHADFHGFKKIQPR